MNKPSILAIFAHPDDEVFRCGGAFALLAQRGVPVTILTFTTGQAGSCGNPPVCSPEELGAVRTQELICSCRTLGIEKPIILDYEDGRLEQVNQAAAEALISAHIQTIQPQVILTWPADGLSGHPDHIAVSRWASAAYHLAMNNGNSELAALYYLAVPQSIASELGLKKLHALPDREITLTVDVHSVWDQKIAAIRCHRTQAGESPILQAPHQRQELFLGKEHFFRACSNQQDDALSDLYREQMEDRKN